MFLWNVGRPFGGLAACKMDDLRLEGEARDAAAAAAADADGSAAAGTMSMVVFRFPVIVRGVCGEEMERARVLFNGDRNKQHMSRV
jgi:hypothetical protein